jgi:hypothetical protein
MSNTFQFIGKISRRKEGAFKETNFGSGWMINDLNLTMTCGDNVQFLRASGGMWDDAHASKNSVMTMKYNENGPDEKLTVKWEDRMKPEIVEMVSNYKTYTIDTEISKVRDEIKASGDAAALEASNRKHKTFITAIDFVRYLDKATSDERTKDWVWKVTGEVEYRYDKGQWYRNFVPRRVYHVDSTTKPMCSGVIKTFFSEGCINEDGENDIIINAYTQYYDNSCKKNCFTPVSLVLAKDHPKANGFKVMYNKASGEEVREFGVNVTYVNGSQKVEISEDMLTEEQKEMLDLGMTTMDDIRQELGGSVYGDRKTETRIKGIARGYTGGTKETVFGADDLAKPPMKDEPKPEQNDDDDFDIFGDDI